MADSEVSASVMRFEVTFAGSESYNLAGVIENLAR